MGGVSDMSELVSGACVVGSRVDREVYNGVVGEV